jgi:hypothetical protein
MTTSGSWPTAVELAIDSSNGWNFWKVSIDGCTVVENSNGEDGASTEDGGYWLDTDATTSSQFSVSSACAPPTYVSFASCAAAACDSDGLNCGQWIEYGTLGQGRCKY